jgi:hypothetical protein
MPHSKLAGDGSSATNTRRNRTGESFEGVTEARDLTVFKSEVVWVTD